MLTIRKRRLLIGTLLFQILLFTTGQGSTVSSPMCAYIDATENLLLFSSFQVIQSSLSPSVGGWRPQLINDPIYALLPFSSLIISATMQFLVFETSSYTDFNGFTISHYEIYIAGTYSECMQSYIKYLKDRSMNNSTTTKSCFLYLPLGNSFPTFNLEKAVCSHGFFMMAPNFWDRKSKTLTRPLRLLSDSSISLLVSISQLPASSNSFLRIQVMFDDKDNIDHTSMSFQDKQYLLDQVARMLRITEKDEMEILEFQRICPSAKKRGFGRVFRSPTLFEDMVKSILLCNCGWSRSLDMAKALCELQFELKHHPNKLKLSRLLKKRKHHDDYDQLASGGSTRSTGVVIGDFPSPAELAKLDETFLEKRCNLGYRARSILDLARTIEAIFMSSSSSSLSSSSSSNSSTNINNKHDLLKRLLLVSNNHDDGVDHQAGKNKERAAEVKNDKYYYDYGKLYKELKGLKGFGPFVCSYVLTCIGCYDRIPADTETVRHLKEVHQKESCTNKTVNKDAEEFYGKYAPFQFLAYWSEIWEFYESRFGKMSKLPPENYKTVTGSFMPAVISPKS